MKPLYIKSQVKRNIISLILWCIIISPIIFFVLPHSVSNYHWYHWVIYISICIVGGIGTGKLIEKTKPKGFKLDDNPDYTVERNPDSIVDDVRLYKSTNDFLKVYYKNILIGKIHGVESYSQTHCFNTKTGEEHYERHVVKDSELDNIIKQHKRDIKLNKLI